MNPHSKKHLLDKGFFDSIINTSADDFKLKNRNIGLIVVTHILPDAVPYLEALNSIFNVDAVFAKPKSVNQKFFNDLSDTFTLTIADRKKLSDISYLSRFIDPKRDGFILLDIGGYFAKVANELVSRFGDKFLGIVEDTENGLHKHLSYQIHYPFYQVARSPLKDNEDYLVGQAIAFSAESIFRESSILFNGQTVGIIGYGKVGKGVAHTLKMRQALVSIYDIDPVRITHAYSHGFIPHTKKDVLLQSSDIICLASGNKSITSTDFSKIRTGAYVFSVTSSDDELDLTFLRRHYSKKIISPLITQYSQGDQFFYLVNDGNAVNFVHGTTVGPFILLVQAEIIACTIALAAKIPPNRSHLVIGNSRKYIADQWLTVFTPKKNGI